MSDKAGSDLITDFENLVDELMKSEPNEHQIRFFMEKLGMEYDRDPVGRIATVLETMNKVIFDSSERRKDYDLQ